MVKKFMIPVGVAVAALFPIKSNAIAPTQPVAASVNGQDKQATAQSGITMQVLQYLKGDERHELLMKTSEAGLLFAVHSSHASHGSHGSHRSSR